MAELLSHTFMQRALIEAVLIGGICAVVGVYVVLNGLSFIGAGISHSTFAGVAIGLLAGVNPLFTALGFSTLVALSIGWVSEKTDLKHDTSVGIFFAATMALGILLIGFLKDFYVDVFSYLFGNILALTASDIWLSLAMTVIIASTFIALFKEFLALSFDAEVASVMGLPVRFLHYLLLVLIALTVVLSVKSVGVVLVSALIVTPAAAAYQLTVNFRRMMLLSVLIGIASSVSGLLLSYWIDFPSGAGIVLIATVWFFLSWLISPRRRHARILTPES
ncbi:MAG: metal ABC transporter permease [Bacteroidetes bacterium]|nr:metal ABC transporter permease [Bacteroidota bacterium]